MSAHPMLPIEPRFMASPKKGGSGPTPHGAMSQCLGVAAASSGQVTLRGLVISSGGAKAGSRDNPPSALFRWRMPVNFLWPLNMSESGMREMCPVTEDTPRRKRWAILGSRAGTDFGLNKGLPLYAEGSWMFVTQHDCGCC